jgi:xanthine/CO dehydrogenase XdhC/CoxF family maturation factor
VHLGTHALLEFCERHRDDPELVLATITGTRGSTYRKPGAMMLISRDGSYEGMISGGCLEGDLLEHAAGVFATGEPARISYDMSVDEDLVWSLGIGCDGVIHLLLQRLDGAEGSAVFTHIRRSHEARDEVLLALVTRSGAEASTGAMATLDRAGKPFGEENLLGLLQEATAEWPEWRSRIVERQGGEVMLVRMPPRTRVLVCGAGPDAVPVAECFAGLDWEVLVVDHRAAFARAERFPPGCRVMHQAQSDLRDRIDLDEVDAAIIMSHHLESDAEYLRQLAGRPLKYLGVLGPTARKDRLREMAGCPGQALFGPVGLDIGAELPGAIALSIAAEVHAVLNRRDGRSLTEVARG